METPGLKVRRNNRNQGQGTFPQSTWVSELKDAAVRIDSMGTEWAGLPGGKVGGAEVQT